MTDPKKQKTMESWRQKCIETFSLQPVPTEWSDQVAKGSDDAWKKYYEYRVEQLPKSKQPKSRAKKDDSDDDESASESEDDYSYEDEGEKELLSEWKENLQNLKSGVFEGSGEPDLWPAHLGFGDLVWDDEKLRSVEYTSQVWSPYTIPHAVALECQYHYRARSTWIEFYVTWAFKFLDFEDFDENKFQEEEFQAICSNGYENCNRVEMIDTSNLTQKTIHKLRRFLLGTAIPTTTHCDDFEFLILLFGSMGTFGFESLKVGGGIGYTWRLPYKDKALREHMIQEGIIHEEDEDDYPSISWLEYAMRQAAGALRPVDKHYQAPTKKKNNSDNAMDNGDFGPGNASALFSQLQELILQGGR
jgi:hypothetical protein